MLLRNPQREGPYPRFAKIIITMIKIIKLIDVNNCFTLIPFKIIKLEIPLK